MCVQVSKTYIVGRFDVGHTKELMLKFISSYANYIDCIYPDIIHNCFIFFFTDCSSPVFYILYHDLTIFGLGVWMLGLIVVVGLVFFCRGWRG